MVASMQGFFSKQFCCYYCRACQWVYVDDNAGLSQFLYTSFGPQASHRNTCRSCLKLFLLRDAPKTPNTFLIFHGVSIPPKKNNTLLFCHVVSLKGKCAVSCIKLFWLRDIPKKETTHFLFCQDASLERNCVFSKGHLKEHYYILNFFPLSAQQSRLVTKQEWLAINGKCPLTDIPGWSPWRTPAKKRFLLLN